ncbi:MAG: DsbA family protein [Rhodospirillaceae bacterium]|nr:DsbA family protein [Rhodospirillaceae bacterium]
MLRKLLLSAFLIASLAASGSASAGEELNAAQKMEVEKIIRDYIANNPDVLMRAMQDYQIRQQAAKLQQARNNLITLAADLNTNPASPVIGNPDGDVTIVEFFDYRCGYCKKVFPTIQALLKEDGNIRYVLKEFPILGPQSVIASQMALAIWNKAPEKYRDFHTALMTARGQLNEKKALSIAENLGIDTSSFAKDMNGAPVTDELNQNMRLAQSLGIEGTPAFVVGQELAPGAISMDELKKMVETARKG